MVGGPGNMAAYRHVLVLTSSTKVVTAAKRKTACRQNITAVLHYRQKKVRRL